MAIPPMLLSIRYRHALKKCNFNTPSVNPFLKKENGGLECFSKPPSSRFILLKAHDNPAATTTVFLFP